MANILATISKGYKKVNTTFEQASFFLLLICVGSLVIIYINNKSTTSTTATDNVYETFHCALTAASDILVPDTSTLKTNTNLSIINYATEVYTSGLTKNYIPAITVTKIVPLTELATCLNNDAQVVIVDINGIKRAYPEWILRYHIAINDTIGDTPVLVTYSPLSNYYQVYNRTVNSEPLVFGISGLLYKNTDLLFDTRTESLWSSLSDKAVVGNMLGADLKKVNFTVMNYAETIATYPDIQAVSFVTGYVRDYAVDPFATYAATDTEIIGTTTYTSKLLANKTQVIGFVVSDQPYAVQVPATTAEVSYTLTLKDSRKATISFKTGQLLSLSLLNGEKVDYRSMYWFVWYDLYPQTQLLTY